MCRLNGKWLNKARYILADYIYRNSPVTVQGASGSVPAFVISNIGQGSGNDPYSITFNIVNPARGSGIDFFKVYSRQDNGAYTLVDTNIAPDTTAYESNQIFASGHDYSIYITAVAHGAEGPASNVLTLAL